jgi:DNA-binding FadR family transcriptional regulator
MRLAPRSAPLRVNLHSAVASHIGCQIVQGKIPPGSILPNEASLGTRYGVSRTALREAIKVLASKGLIEVRRKTGTRVNTHAKWSMLDPEVLTWMFSGKDIPTGLADLMEVRMLIEPAAARMAAQKACPEDLKEISDACEEMEAATGDPPPSVESDLRFHMAVLEATHNAFMRPFGALIQAALRGSVRLTSSNTDLYRLTLPRHRKVLSAIELGDAHTAEAEMRALLTQTLRDINDQTRAIRQGRKKITQAKRTPHRTR